ncbi:MAG: hypothetical protein QNJ97_05085 [Myxococcota bacterium]|nr:hypothetical protein [Myxococcota bacterium]
MHTSETIIKQTSGLVFRKVDNFYYVTNPHRRQVAVLNGSAFRVLELAENRSVNDLCQMLCSVKDSSSESTEVPTALLDRGDVIECLQALDTANLIQFE